MPFDLASAKPVGGGFDLSTAKPVASAKPERSTLDTIKQGAIDLASGALRGASSIGATILAPIDMAKDALDGKGLSLQSNRIRRADVDAGLAYFLGADPDSLAYKAGKLGGEVAGTAGMGGLLANGVRAVAPGATGLAEAVATGGFRAGQTTGAANLLTRALGGAITGGASAGLVNPEDAGTGALVGGALPVAASAVGKTAKAVGRAVRGGDVSPEVANLAARAKQLGIDVPADRLVDSKPLNALASSLNYVPLSGRSATESNIQNQLNKALSRTFGQDSDNVTAALRKASSDLGGKFDTVLRNNSVAVDNQFLTDLSASESKALSELSPDQASIIKRQIDTLLDKGQTGAIDGQAAYNIKKTLDRIGRRNSPEAHYAIDLKNNLMDALNRSLGPDEAAAFATTRKQYGNMLTLEKLAQNGAEGDISIGRLANLKNIGNDDVQELADIAAQFLKSREGSHGAAQRVGIGGLMTLLGGPAGLATGVAAGRGANMLLNSGLAKNAVLGAPNPALTNATNKLLPIVYRAAPILTDQ